jgi:hypothetical protein
MKKMLVLLAVVALAVPAFAQDSDSAVLNINSIVDDYIMISDTQDLDVETPVTGIDLASDTAYEDMRALFTVTANGAYDLRITAAHTFTADHVSTTYQQVKFLADSGDFHGGSVFLDPTPGVEASGDGDLIRWNGTAGEIDADGVGMPGTKTWGIGGQLLPNLTDVEGEIVPAGTYTAALTVEAAIN